MSASSLPPELWRHIFALATATHHRQLYFQISWDVPLEEDLWNGWKVMNTRRMLEEFGPGSASQLLKTTLLRVCKHWRALSIDLAYRHLFVLRHPIDIRRERYLKTLTSLAVSLEGSDARFGNGFGYGRWTKRFDIPFDAFHDDYLPLTLRILSCLSNLQVLRVAVCSGMHPSALQQLSALCSSRFSHSLKRLHWFFRGDTEEAYLDSLTYLPAIPLTSLVLYIHQPQAPPTHPNAPPHTAFGTVISLSLTLTSTIHSLPQSWIFPSLRHLSILGVLPDDVDAVVGFLRLNAAPVTAFSTDSASQLEWLLPHMPLLNSIVLRFTSASWTARFNISFGDTSSCHLGNLTHIGILWTDFASITRSELLMLHFIVAAVFKIPWQRRYPHLRVIRLMNEVATDLTYDETMSLEDTIETCALHGVRLEDRLGVLIRPE